MSPSCLPPTSQKPVHQNLNSDYGCRVAGNSPVVSKSTTHRDSYRSGYIYFTTNYDNKNRHAPKPPHLPEFIIPHKLIFCNVSFGD